VGFGLPYKDYCTATGELTTNHGVSVMQPYYFPFVRSHGGILEGFFDYRPRNEQEALVGAVSSDWGASWSFKSEALRLNPYCPADPSDPGNLNVIVNGLPTAYGSSPNNAADNGLGHSFVLEVGGVQRVYQLNRANNHIDFDQLVVHTLPTSPAGSLSTLPDFGYVSPFKAAIGGDPGGYPALDPTALATIGLTTPDAFLGAVRIGASTTVVYVSKALNADLTSPGFTSANRCPKTPGFALTNLVNGKPRKPNDDVITIRVATTTDGITFTDVGAGSGLEDQMTVALNGIRWLSSGSLIPLTNGHYGLFFGAGNCLDNDSDGFHFIGYAEPTNPVPPPSDLQSWHVIYGFDNPILSTDTVIDKSMVPPRPYPLNPPVVDVLDADALTAAQVAPFVAPAGEGPYDTNFFSGRVYDPQAVYTDSQTVTIVFAGYNTPQPSNNLGDYRTIGRFQLRFPPDYVAPF